MNLIGFLKNLTFDVQLLIFFSRAQKILENIFTPPRRHICRIGVKEETKIQ